MEIQELWELKKRIVDKYVKGGKQEKELKNAKRALDKIIKRKVAENGKNNFSDK